MQTTCGAKGGSSELLPEDQRYNPRKMFVGGLGPHITARSLIEYFSKYGEVSDSSIVLDRVTGRSRGFGFVIFKDIQSVDRCGQKLRHIIENVNCEVRKAVPREDARQQSEMGARCKVFVSGLSEATRENHLREYFEAFGTVEEANIKTDRNTGRSRGFAFVLFKTPEAARQSLGPHPELGPTVEAKIAEPRTPASSAKASAPPPVDAPVPQNMPPPSHHQRHHAPAVQWPPYDAYAPYPHLADGDTQGFEPTCGRPALVVASAPPPECRPAPSFAAATPPLMATPEIRPWFEPSLHFPGPVRYHRAAPAGHFRTVHKEDPAFGVAPPPLLYPRPPFETALTAASSDAYDSEPPYDWHPPAGWADWYDLKPPPPQRHVRLRPPPQKFSPY